MGRVKIKEIGQVVKTATADFKKHNILKLSASLAFYTMFSLAPMLLIIIFISNIFLGKQAVEGSLTEKYQALLENNLRCRFRHL